MQYSSFWNTYLYSPDSSVYILPGGQALSPGPRDRPASPPPRRPDAAPVQDPAPQCLLHRLQLPAERAGAARDPLPPPDGGPHAFAQLGPALPAAPGSRQGP